MRAVLLLATLLIAPAWGMPEPPFCEKGMLNWVEAGCNDLTNQEWCRKRGAFTSNECFIYRTYGAEKMKEMRAAKAKLREEELAYEELTEAQIQQRAERLEKKCLVEGKAPIETCKGYTRELPKALEYRREKRALEKSTRARASATNEKSNPFEDTLFFFGTLSAFVGITIALLFLLLYMLPAIIARAGKHPNTLLIIILNIFLGWSIIGWLAILIWAIVKPTERAILAEKKP